jgi:hypothetical protein
MMSTCMPATSSGAHRLWPDKRAELCPVLLARVDERASRMLNRTEHVRRVVWLGSGARSGEVWLSCGVGTGRVGIPTVYGISQSHLAHITYGKSSDIGISNNVACVECREMNHNVMCLGIPNVCLGTTKVVYCRENSKYV